MAVSTTKCQNLTALLKRTSLNDTFKRFVSIEATPRVALWDVPSKITASELPRNSPVTIRAEIPNHKGVLFRSAAHYITDENGSVDLSKDHSVGGSYKGCLPVGLLASLRGVQKKFENSRLHFKDLMEPKQFLISVHSGHIDGKVEAQPLASMELERHIVRPGTLRIPIREGRIRGTLFLPPGPGPHPGVIDLYGGVGGLIEQRAAHQASRGFATLALAYFNYDDLSPNVHGLTLEYFEEAVEFLTSVPSVIPDRCGIWASCLGGMYGILMGGHIEKVKAVATINGICLPFGSHIDYKGKPITNPGIDLSSFDMNFTETGVTTCKEEKVLGWLEDEDNVLDISKASEDTKILAVTTAGCTYFGNHHAKALKKKANKQGRDNVEILHYEFGGGHIIEPPYASTPPIAFNPYWPNKDPNNKFDKKGVIMGFGGTIEDNYRVMVDMWPRILDFFELNIRQKSKLFTKVKAASVA